MARPTPKRSKTTKTGQKRTTPTSRSVEPSAHSPRRRRYPLYRLRVSLRDVNPEIWRVVEVPGEVTLPRLHLVLQVAMGWENYHLHAFRVEGATYGIPSPDGDDFLPVADERDVTLDDVVLRHGPRAVYEYDFGDGWEHEVTIEEIPRPAGTRKAICVAGQRACPPEDVGGPYGYENYLAALRDPKHPEHRECLQWRGPFEPEKFDVGSVNHALGSGTKGRRTTRS